MSILDYTTGLFREPASLRAFVDDPHQALADAGLPDATPEQVLELLPLVAESMPPDHPLQAVVSADDPVAALRALDIEDLIADVLDHHRDVERIEKAVGGPETISLPAQSDKCGPAPDDQGMLVEPAAVGNWDVNAVSEKAIGGVVDIPPEIEAPPETGDDYPDADDDQAAKELVEPDISSVSWGQALE
jgi:hypothetical protein